MAAIWVYKSGASSTLGATYTAGNTTVTVATGDGSKFASPTGGQFAFIRISNPNQTYVIKKVTGRSGDVLTVAAGAFGNTTDQNGTIGWYVDEVVTEEAMNQVKIDSVLAVDHPIAVGWMMSTGVTGSNVGKRLAAQRIGSIYGGQIVVDASDGSTALTFDIKKNGTSIFTSARTIAAGTSAGTVTSLTSALTSNPTTVAIADVFTLDITSGTSSWQFTVAMG
jgi:hypothetical protein